MQFISLFFLLSLLSLCLAGRDYYDLLGVPRDAPTSVIKKSYRRLAKLYHPDKHPGDDKMEAKFKDISKAYEVLANQERRQTYDQFGEEGLQQGGSGGGGFHGGNFGGGGDGFRMEFDASMFEDMFGGGGGGGGFGGGGFGGGGFNHGRRKQKRETRRKICSENKVCENGRCFMVKECKS